MKSKLKAVVENQKILNLADPPADWQVDVVAFSFFTAMYPMLLVLSLFPYAKLAENLLWAGVQARPRVCSDYLSPSTSYIG